MTITRSNVSGHPHGGGNGPKRGPELGSAGGFAGGVSARPRLAERVSMRERDRSDEHRALCWPNGTLRPIRRRSLEAFGEGFHNRFRKQPRRADVLGASTTDRAVSTKVCNQCLSSCAANAGHGSKAPTNPQRGRDQRCGRASHYCQAHENGDAHRIAPSSPCRRHSREAAHGYCRCHLPAPCGRRSVITEFGGVSRRTLLIHRRAQ